MRLFKPILICAAALLITSCMVDATSSGSNSTTSGLSAGTSTDYNSSSTVDTATYSNVIYLNLTDGTASDDNSTWTEIGIGSDYAITFFDESVSIKYTKNDGESTGLIKVDATAAASDLAFYLSGTMTTGGVKIQSNGTNTIALYLNDATITSSSYPCVEVTKGSPALVYLSGTNTFADGRAYGTGYGEQYTTISGTTYTDDDGNTTECTVVQTAVEEGSDSKGTLYCKGNLTVSGSGSLKITQAYKNCIASKADLVINGGTYTLTSTGKNGLMADSSVTVNDGTITFNGTGAISSSECRKANAIKTDTDDSDSSVTIAGGTLTVTTCNGKGINSSKVYISGGTNTFKVTGVTGYTSDSNKTATYYDADGVKYSNTSVTFAAEGIEGASVITISGGTTEVTATDDALNVSDDGSTFTLSGGYLYCYSTGGDGVDSNGSISISDGVVVSYAPTGSEDALDCGDNYKITISGGVVAGTCGSTMATSSLSRSDQKILYYTGSSGGMRAPSAPGSSSSSSFSTVAIKVSDSYVYAFELPSSSFGLFLMSCPEVTSSSSYTVYTDPTLSGGTDFNGLYAASASETAIPSVSGGTSSSPSVK